MHGALLFLASFLACSVEMVGSPHHRPCRRRNSWLARERCGASRRPCWLLP